MKSLLKTFLFLAALFPLSAKAQIAAPPDLDAVRAGQFDTGKMWTFDNPPLDYFREAYGFSPDAAWFEKARLGALRLPNCSASFVSPFGLVMTNHHCTRGYTTRVARPGEALLDTGFYAPSLDEERRIPDLYVDQLVALTDVTAELDAAAASAQTDAERAAARQEAIAAITQRLTEQAGGEAGGFLTQIVALYNGGKYSAYTFRRYDDVRLVQLPEVMLGAFGGDADNFTYPRFSLDAAFLRVYDNGGPLRTEHAFGWAEDGVEAGDPVFVVGNPGSTFRLETVAQLEYRRDVREPRVLAFFSDRIARLEAALKTTQEPALAEALRNTISTLKNAQKLYRGRVKALDDPVILARKGDAERQFRDAVEADETLRAAYADQFDEMTEIQRQKGEIATDFRAFAYLQPNFPYGSGTLQRALLLAPYAGEAGTNGGLPEQVKGQVLAQPFQPAAVDRAYLVARLTDLQTYLGEDSPLVRGVLQGQSPEVAAGSLLQSSILADSARTAQALASGAIPADDPALRIVLALRPQLGAFQSAFAGLTAQENEVAARLGRARFDVYGTAVPPDATFSLRLADGVVKGYAYNGTEAPPYTNFFGLYDHYYSYGKGTEWDLPAAWVPPPADFDLATPLNFVSTNDIIGGNSGSPILNKDLEVVGVAFDGNIESLVGSYLYLEDPVRTVSVDGRGILEALDVIYDADRLVLELTERQLVATEAEADAAMSGTR